MTWHYSRTIATCAAVLLFPFIDDVFAQERPAELKVLDRYVGTWLHEFTLLPSKS
jgi:hypothetical protein